MTAETTTTTVAATTTRRPSKDGMFTAVGTVIKSVSNVVSDIAIAGSVASSGLMISAERFRLDAAQDLIEEYGDASKLSEMQTMTNDLLDRIRNSR